jgi:hypothetical protein
LSIFYIDIKSLGFDLFWCPFSGISAQKKVEGYKADYTGLIMYIAGKLMISVCSSTTVIQNFFMNSKLSRNNSKKEWALSPWLIY